MKKRKDAFAKNLKMFSLCTLALLFAGIVFACSNMDMDLFANSILTAGGVLSAGVPIWFVMKDGVSTFKALTDEERKDFTDEENSKYLADLIKWQTKAIKDLTEKAEKDDANKVEIEKQLKELQKANISTMRKSLDDQGVAMKKLMDEVKSKTDGQPLTLKSAIYKSLHDNKDAIKESLKTASGSIELEIKASQAASDIDAGTDFAEMEPGVGQLATRQPFMRSLFVNKNTSKEYVKYNDQETIVRDAKNVAGCAASTHNSKLTWKVRTMQIVKIRDFVDICLDMMDDYDYVQSEIRGLIETDVMLKIDSDLLLSDGIAPNPNSVDAVASTFAAGSYANAIAKAQLIDLLMVAASQISDLGQNNKFQPNVALLNPIDATKMKLLKDADGNYMMPNWITSDGVNMGGLRVIANQLVPVNEAYVMDSTKGTVYSRRGLTVSLSFENNANFEKELVTMKAYERLNLRIRNVDANAFMHISDITAGIAAITLP